MKHPEIEQAMCEAVQTLARDGRHSDADRVLHAIELFRALPSVQTEELSFIPTHVHADGGFYRFVAKSKYKASFTFPGAAEWTDAVIYEASDRKLYVTTPSRWADRFADLAKSVSPLERRLTAEEQESMMRGFQKGNEEKP